MKAQVQQLMQRFDALQLRERALVAGMVLMVVVLSSWQWGIEPVIKQRTLQREQMLAAQASLADLEVQRAELQLALTRDPNRRLRERVLQLEQERDALNTALGGLQGRLMDPAAMTALLQQVLTTQPDLRVVKVINLPPQALVTATPDGAEAAPATEALPVLYAHEAEIVVRGPFHPLLAYVQDVERLGDRLLWAALRYQVTTYPEAELHLRVRTLSVYREWLGV